MKTFYHVMLVVWGMILGLGVGALIVNPSILPVFLIVLSLFFIIRDYKLLVELENES